MLFAGREVCIGENCARGLEYGPRPRAVLKTKADSRLKEFHTVRVRLTFRPSKPVLFTEVLKGRDSAAKIAAMLGTAGARGISQSDSRI